MFAVLADVPGTQAALDGLTRTVAAAGGEFVGSAVMDSAATDYTPVALRIKGLRPDYITINLNAAPSARLFNAPRLTTPTRRGS